ncbi:Hypothetical_protein [Hexamita inflata]|uniref:Hypothetical_protein n=1 Tax=Hexamita inflata TaxID=28002 RepID=A0ABP1HHJ9_9EUKA
MTNCVLEIKSLFKITTYKSTCVILDNLIMISLPEQMLCIDQCQCEHCTDKQCNIYTCKVLNATLKIDLAPVKSTKKCNKYVTQLFTAPTSAIINDSRQWDNISPPPSPNIMHPSLRQ